MVGRWCDPRRPRAIGNQAQSFSSGPQVQKGQLIAEIDPPMQRNALLNAEAILVQDRAQRASRAAALK
jgi:multidrug efflux pump subunit AcrA (membrane-fusion protein)